MEKGPTKKDLETAYRLNELVDNGEETTGYASNASEEKTEEAIAGLTSLELKEYKELSAGMENLEENSVFQTHLVSNLVSAILKKIDPETFDLAGTSEMYKILLEKTTGQKGGMVNKKVFDTSEKVDAYVSMLTLQQQLTRMGTYEKILSWCKQQNPPIKFTQWDLGHIRLYALRGFRTDLDELATQSVQ